MKISDAFLICVRNNIKVYPIHKKGFWYVQVSIGDRIVKTYDKIIGSGYSLTTAKPQYRDTNWITAINNTIIFYAEKFVKKHNEK